MSLKKELNLVGVVSPMCLLKCKSVLTRMNPGDILEVLVEDPDVVDELIKILKRSSDHVKEFYREENHFRIHLEKGEDICT